MYSTRHYDTLNYLKSFYKFGKIDGPKAITGLLNVLESPHKYQVLNWSQLRSLVDLCALVITRNINSLKRLSPCLDYSPITKVRIILCLLTLK